MQLMRVAVIIGLASLMLVGSGCENWKGKYQACNAEMENLQALFEGSQQALQDCSADRNAIAQQLRSCQNKWASRQEEQKVDHGFGDEDVSIDARKGTITVTLENQVLFDPGKVTLKSAAKTRISNIANVIRSKYAGKDVSVVGHTDTDPIKKSKWKDNWELSCQRALAVTRYLVGQGIPAKQLAAAGRGEFHPQSTKASSRRVEIVVYMY